MAISRLQGTHNEQTGQISSLAYTSALTANSLLIVTALWCTASDYPTHPTVSGTQNGSFGTAVAGFWDATLQQGMAIFAIQNTKGAVSETINFTWNGSSNYCSVTIEEFSGVSATLDGSSYQSQSGLGTGTDNISSGSFTTTVDGDLIYAFTSSAGGASHVTAMAAGTGFSWASAEDYAWVNAAEYKIQSTHGSTAGTFSPTNSGGTTNWTTIAVAFKPAPTVQYFGYVNSDGTPKSDTYDFGSDNDNIQWQGPYVCPGTAGQTMVVTDLSIRCNKNSYDGHSMVAIYTQAGALVCYTPSFIVNDAYVQWFGVHTAAGMSPANATLIAGQSYYLAFNTQIGDTASYVKNGGSNSYASQTFGSFSSTLPSSSGSFDEFSIRCGVTSATASWQYSGEVALSLTPEHTEQYQSGVPSGSYSDDFHRASLGSNWTTAFSNWNTLVIQGNLLTNGESVNSTAGNYYNAATFPDDQYSEVTISSLGANYDFGLLVRSNAAGCYMADWWANTVALGGDGTGPKVALIIHHYSGNSNTWLANVDCSVSPGDKLRLSVQGNVFILSKNGRPFFVHTDSTFTSGKPGIKIYEYPDANNTYISYWQGGSFLAMALTPPMLSSPADGATGVTQPITFSWQAVTGAVEYQIEVATDAAFSNLVVNTTTSQTSYQVNGLQSNTLHYWRVRAKVS